MGRDSFKVQMKYKFAMYLLQLLVIVSKSRTIFPLYTISS